MEAGLSPFLVEPSVPDLPAAGWAKVGWEQSA